MATSERTTHSKKQFLGLALVAGVLVFAVGLTLALGEAGDGFFFVFVAAAAIAVAIAYLAWRFDTLWARVVGLVGALLLLFATFFFIFGIFEPFSPIEFVIGVAYTIGIILAIVGGIMAIVAGRRGKMGATARDNQLPRAIAIVLGAAVVISIVGFFATRSTVSDAEAAGAVEVQMKNSEFTPEIVTAAAGTKLLVKNSDLFTHDFTIDEYDIEVKLGPGSSKLVEIPASATGSVPFYCSIHSDGDGPSRSGMTGSITIGS